jgi:hypothetical protein
MYELWREIYTNLLPIDIYNMSQTCVDRYIILKQGLPIENSNLFTYYPKSNKVKLRYIYSPNSKIVSIYSLEKVIRFRSTNQLFEEDYLGIRNYKYLNISKILEFISLILSKKPTKDMTITLARYLKPDVLFSRILQTKFIINNPESVECKSMEADIWTSEIWALYFNLNYLYNKSYSEFYSIFGIDSSISNNFLELYEQLSTIPCNKFRILYNLSIYQNFH